MAELFCPLSLIQFNYVVYYYVTFTVETITSSEATTYKQLSKDNQV